MTPLRPDYYEILGVPRNASAADIQRAFRTLARQWHPDVNTRDNAAARFHELSTAYEVLHDPIERARYDHSAVSVRRREAVRRPQRPMFSPRSQPSDVPRFLDQQPSMWPPIVIRVGAIFRWLS